jgi:signal transduction histidine kinase
VLHARTRRLGVLLAAATLAPVVALTWLGVHILRQDRELEHQRRRERLEVSAGRLAVDIERTLLGVEERLAAGGGIRFVPAGLESPADQHMLYQPDGRSFERQAPAGPLAQAEREEFGRRDLPAAATAYRRLAETSAVEVRAAALVGLGRVLRQRKEAEGALRAYRDLQDLGGVLVAGQPAALVGYQGRCRVLEEAAEVAALQQCAAALARSLARGEWPIERATFELYRDLLAGWGAAPLPSEGIMRTDVAMSLWHAWRAGSLPARGRRVIQQDSVAVLAVWTGGPERPSLWLATGAELDATWSPLWQAEGLTVALSDPDGGAMLGSGLSPEITLHPGQTRLPFILGASRSGTEAQTGAGSPRAALVGGLLLALVLTLGGAYGIYRTTTRELLLTRQQSDFVSAVSHEFRTPLTSMRHLTELLVGGTGISEDRRTYYYALLAQETERLHRMVEGLLSFGRIDAGAYAWQLEPADVGQMLGDAVDEFRRERIAADRELRVEIADGLPTILADREALSRAVWNLLENAGKYSEPASPIRIFARRQGNAVLIGVEDQGTGIPSTELDSIFQKFVRGADARRARIRGVGMGLTLVQRIAEAHGGSVQLETEPGRGSTFTLVIPCHES